MIIVARRRTAHAKNRTLIAVGALHSVSAQTRFPLLITHREKKNFNYNEWTKGKFSEVVTVTNPGKFIFLAGIGPEREGDGKIVHEGNFMEQCRYAYMKIKKLLDMQSATMNDVVRIMTYTTDVRFFQDALKCRAEAFGSAPIPASTFLVVSQLAWPNMAIEVDVTAMLAR
jgi:2-iminobutanoate/2-iminopropanoate deaminase